MGISILYSIIVVPYSIGFMADAEPNSVQGVLNKFVDAIFLADMLVTFQTPFINRIANVLIVDRVAITKNYLSSWFLIDLAASVPFEEIALSISEDSSQGSHIRSFKLLRILRLARLAKLFRLFKSHSFKDLLEKSLVSPSVMSVVILLFQIFLFAHILGCFWFFISTDSVTGATSSNDPNVTNTVLTWATVYGCDQADKGSQYIISLYWTFQTLLSVGYGDIHPTNTPERAYGFLVMLLGGLMFGSIIAKVGGRT